jgi:hypothetical protein
LGFGGEPLLDGIAMTMQALLPGGGDSVVLVTSRGSLYGLIALTGARLIRVRPPDADEAIVLVAGRLGAQRVAAEPAAMRDIVELCGRLPLALAVVAARAVAHEHLSLATIADKLRGSRGALDALRTPDAAVDVRRMLDYYLHTSHAAAIIAFPSRYRVPIDPPVSGVICTEQDATWFDATIRYSVRIGARVRPRSHRPRRQPWTVRAGRHV